MTSENWRSDFLYACAEHPETGVSAPETTGESEGVTLEVDVEAWDGEHVSTKRATKM